VSPLRYELGFYIPEDGTTWFRLETRSISFAYNHKKSHLLQISYLTGSAIELVLMLECEFLRDQFGVDPGSIAARSFNLSSTKS
jgi:hypothetical protein